MGGSEALLTACYHFQGGVGRLHSTLWMSVLINGTGRGRLLLEKTRMSEKKGKRALVLARHLAVTTMENYSGR
jgi:hypothetical protein